MRIVSHGNAGCFFAPREIDGRDGVVPPVADVGVPAVLAEHDPVGLVSHRHGAEQLELQAELAQNESREAEAMSNYMIAISELERAKGTLLRYNNIIMEESPLDSTERAALER